MSKIHSHRQQTQIREFELVFGGTFDPIHYGHIAIIEQLRKLDKLSTIRVIPCATPALKQSPGASFSQRCKMLELGLAHFSHLIIDQREQKRSGASYTFDTLQALKQAQPNKHLIFVIGADNLVDFQRWHRWQELAKYCHLLVINRPNFNESLIKESVAQSGFQLAKSYADLQNAHSGLIFYHTMPQKDQSSTEIRNNFQQKRSLDLMLPQSVIEYAMRNLLYQSEES